MNYLAHAYLSFDEGEILTGNFIADTVKGNSAKFNDRVREGIRLHHKIDEFTDNNLHFRKSVRRLDGKYGPYAPIIIDMFYDHYLAVNWSRYHQDPLPYFIAGVYGTLLAFYPILPARMKRMLPYLVSINWLEYYQNPSCFRHFFLGLSFRAQNATNLRDAASEIFSHYEEFNDDFINFMSEIIPYVKNLQN